MTAQEAIDTFRPKLREFDKLTASERYAVAYGVGVLMTEEDAASMLVLANMLDDAVQVWADKAEADGAV